MSKANKPRPIRTQKELQDDSDTLFYEYEMLAKTWIEIKDDTPRTLRNALIQSFAVHARSLISFCFDNTDNPTDIFAIDYVPSWAEEMTPFLDNAKKKANKQIAHITTERRNLNQPGRNLNQPEGPIGTWDLLEIAFQLAVVMHKFFDACPVESLSESARRGIGETTMLIYAIKNQKAPGPVQTVYGAPDDLLPTVVRTEVGTIGADKVYSTPSQNQVEGLINVTDHACTASPQPSDVRTLNDHACTERTDVRTLGIKSPGDPW
jgi:hypothetical protein